MKRNMIVAAVAATAVIGGGAVAGAALTGGNERSGHADELNASNTGGDGGTPSNPRPPGGSDDREDTADGGTGRSGGPDDASGSGGWSGVAEKVERTALATAPGYVVDIERDDEDDDGRAWEVDVAGDDGRRHELRISPDGTEVLEHERDDDDDDVREKRRLLSNASVLAGDAARIAEEHSGASVEELELEKDEKAWDLELKDTNGVEWELKVHVDSGKVFDVERDG